mgnify:CR=1 FL=1
MGLDIWLMLKKERYNCVRAKAPQETSETTHNIVLTDPYSRFQQTWILAFLSRIHTSFNFYRVYH